VLDVLVGQDILEIGELREVVVEVGAARVVLECFGAIVESGGHSVEGTERTLDVGGSSLGELEGGMLGLDHVDVGVGIVVDHHHTGVHGEAVDVGAIMGLTRNAGFGELRAIVGDSLDGDLLGLAGRLLLWETEVVLIVEQ
jgi:hypothetical protein